MIGGSIDMLATGAVSRTSPRAAKARRSSINDVEFATAQLWVREDRGSRASRT